MKYILSTILLSLLSLAHAQGVNIKVVPETIDMGELEELDSVATAEFKVFNTSSNVVVLNEVEKLCGCLAPVLEKDTLLPGDSSIIKVSYTTWNRPGIFEKTMMVKSNLKDQVKLTLYGYVRPAMNNIAERYPFQSGALRLKTEYIHIGDITNEKEVVKVVRVFNESDSDVVFDTTQLALPDHLQLDFEPTVLQSHGLGKMIFTYNPKVKNDFGYTRDAISLPYELGDSVNNLVLFPHATIKMFMPELTDAELSLKPKFTLGKKVKELGSVKVNTKTKSSFTFSNTGKEDLEILKVKTNCYCLKASVPQKVIKPGESGKVEFTFDSSNRIGSQSHKNIILYTNDPRALKVILEITAYVKK